ncbi:MAG: DegT/DnrJ/EryC1/StrS family aminotransferase, partial [Pseudomonadota bacterium]
MSDRPAVPFFDAWTAGLRTTWGDELRAWRAIQERGVFLGGPEVAAFETEWASKVGAQHAVAVASGTAALTLALRAVGIRPVDISRAPVLIPAFT